jgi:hypothetical protein
VTKENKTSSKSFPRRLARACEGLNYVSETDSAVEPLFGGEARSTSASDVLAAVGVSVPNNTDERDYEKFFARLSDQKDWFGASQRKNAQRFEALKHLLESELSDLRVFRVGKVQNTIYILGVGRDGKIAGVKMDAVET